jgi:hypothetical protein
MSVGNTHVTENTESSLFEPSSSGEKMRNVVGLRLMTSVKRAIMDGFRKPNHGQITQSHMTPHSYVLI